MKKEIREVDQERGILQITTVDERFYARSVKNAESGLPCYDFVPSVTFISESFPKGYAYWRWLADKGWSQAEDIRIAAGDKGSKIHYGVKALVHGETVSMESEFFNESLGRMEPVTVEEYGALMSFVGWCSKAKPEFIDAEFVVWSEEYRYAGMVDLSCKLSDEYLAKEKLPLGGVWDIDVKSGQNIWPSYELQLSAYRHADRQCDRTAVLQVGYQKNKHHWKFTEIPDEFDLFLAARKIWEHEHGTESPKQIEYPLSLSLEGIVEPIGV